MKLLFYVDNVNNSRTSRFKVQQALARLLSAVLELGTAYQPNQNRVNDV